jgi:hypothetical protein
MSKSESSPVRLVDLDGQPTVVIVVDEGTTHQSIRAAARLARKRRDELRPNWLRPSLLEQLSQRQAERHMSYAEIASYVNTTVAAYRRHALEEQRDAPSYRELSRHWLRTFEILEDRIEAWWNGTHEYTSAKDGPVRRLQVIQALKRWRERRHRAEPVEKAVVIPVRSDYRQPLG